jgi:hypothetical protein
MRKNISSVAVFFLSAVVIAISGCRSVKTVDKTPGEKLNTERIDTDITTVANSFKSDFFEGIEKNDYSLFVKNFTPELKEKYTPQTFEQFVKSYNESSGKLISSELLGEIERYPMRVFIWKLRFEKDKLKLSDDEMIQRDRLFYVQIGKVDGKYQIFSMHLN